MPVLVPSGPVGPVLPLSSNKVVRGRYKVEVAWGQNSRGLFTFGISQFGGPDVLAASAWSQTFTDPHADITNPGDGTRVDTINVVRGRDDDLNATQAGTSTITINDKVGKFNNKNGSSVLAGFLQGNQPLRITCTFGGITYPIYYGFIQEILYQRIGERGGQAQISCLDLMSKLAPAGSGQSSNPILPSLGPTTTGAAIGRVLDFYQWTDPAMRALAVGDNILDFFADGSVTALQLIEDLLTAERGFFYIGASGRVMYQSRNQRFAEVSAGTIQDVMDVLQEASDTSVVVNEWQVQRTDFSGAPIGVLRTADDVPSQHLYNIISQSVQTPYLPNDMQAYNLALFLLSRTRSASTPVWGMNLRNKDAATLAMMLGRELGDRVTIGEDVTPSTNDYYVEQISHDISMGGLDHRTTWKLSQRPPWNPFVFGVSQFGGSDVLTY